ncbi:hypothetical protein ScalyP_jg5549 [Parmales sp. scaly parma]|nr:hypothetical protein ScalyP_jg5549 [Parmales sp. scaly parma]
MRELKYHEKKLLRKVNLYSWKGDENIRVSKILRRYHISDRNDYATYSKLCGHITKLTAKLKTMDGSDPFRIDVTSQMTKKLFDMGVLNNKVGNLKQCEDIGVSSFCRRRLPVVMVRMKMSETLKEAVTFIEQGQVRVGPDVVTDPAFLVSRSLEDFTTWVDSSKIKRTVAKYNDKLDDYDLL